MPKRKLSKILQLDNAFNRVLKEEKKGRKLIPDPLCFCDCQDLKDEILGRITKSLDVENYEGHSLLKMDVPKNNFCIRPGAVPNLEDWIVYDAFANYVGYRSDANLSPVVSSYRFNKFGQLLPGVKQWKKFENSFWNTLESSDSDSCVIWTDISSYFTNIHLSVLRPQLLTIIAGASKTNERIINSLFNSLLKRWAKGPIQQDLGIPQGVDASSIIGNLLLHHLDAEISKIEGIKYFRYVDDMRIIAPNRVEAKKVLRQLSNALAQIGLEVNPSKTKILGKDAAKAQKDPCAEHMSLVDAMIKSRLRPNITLVKPILWRIFEGALDKNNPLYNRHLNFSINRFVLLKKELRNNRRFVLRVTEMLIKELEGLPGCTAEFAFFFRNFPSLKGSQLLCDFLRSKDNIYEWQEMWILDSLLRFQRISPENVRLFGEIAKDRRKHQLCRAKALLLFGKFGDQHAKHELAAIYEDEHDSIIKRSIVFATQELAQAERNTFYDMVKTDPSMTHTIAFIKKLKKPKYYEEEDWKPIDIEDFGSY